MIKNKEYQAALLSIDFYNSIPNITEENNIFKYSIDNGLNWKIITIPKGCYELSTINDEYQRQMIVNGDYNINMNSTSLSLRTLPNFHR